MRIKRALLSVSDKTGIVKLAQFLHDIGVEIISTGGTMTAIREAGIPVTYVSDVTGFPEIMDGRVKTFLRSTVVFWLYAVIPSIWQLWKNMI